MRAAADLPEVERAQARHPPRRRALEQPKAAVAEVAAGEAERLQARQRGHDQAREPELDFAALDAQVHEAVACVEALRTGRLHPNINLDDPEDAVDMSIMVGKEACDLPPGGGVVLSNSFGFGGHNSSVMFRRFVE